MPFSVAGLGEILWDVFPGGRKLGGAPANFAYHAAALGADARVISRVGNDELGREILASLQKLGLSTDCLETDPTAPTGTVTVSIDSAGQPEYLIHQNVAWDRLAGETAARQTIAHADAICFGSLAQRSEASRSTIQTLLRQTRPGALRIFDINLRQNYYSPELIAESLALANVLKVNETELPILAQFFDLTGDERSQIARLAERHDLKLIAYTRGARGSLLFLEGRWSDHPGVPAQVADTVGAGDSFTAAMTLGLLAGWDLDRINESANRIAAYVASQPGATPALPQDLRAPFLQNL